MRISAACSSIITRRAKAHANSDAPQTAREQKQKDSDQHQRLPLNPVPQPVTQPPACGSPPPDSSIHHLLYIAARRNCVAGRFLHSEHCASRRSQRSVFRNRKHLSRHCEFAERVRSPQLPRENRQQKEYIAPGRNYFTGRCLHSEHCGSRRSQRSVLRNRKHLSHHCEFAEHVRSPQLPRGNRQQNEYIAAELSYFTGRYLGSKHRGSSRSQRSVFRNRKHFSPHCEFTEHVRSPQLPRGNRQQTERRPQRNAVQDACEITG